MSLLKPLCSITLPKFSFTRLFLFLFIFWSDTHFPSMNIACPRALWKPLFFSIGLKLTSVNRSQNQCCTDRICSNRNTHNSSHRCWVSQAMDSGGDCCQQVSFHWTPVFCMTPRLRSSRGQRPHFPFPPADPSLSQACFGLLECTSPAGWPWGSAAVNHSLSLPQQPLDAEQRMWREASERGAPVSAYGIISVHLWCVIELAIPSPILTQTSGWVTTLYVRGKGLRQWQPDIGRCICC